jgi:hypothetical protein
MLIVFANNQAMAADGASGGAPSVITTDPVAMNGNDRVSMILNAHYFFGAGGAVNRSFSVQPQVSNDGVTFLSDGAAITINETSDTPLQTVRTINGAYLRMQYTLTATPVVANAHICFDHHVNMDHV